MNKVFPLVMMLVATLLTVAACTPTTRWEKPGVDALTAEREKAECRGMSAAVAQRIYSQPPPAPWAGSESWTPYAGYRLSSSNQWIEAAHTGEDRYATENRFRVWCLRKRGYVEVPIAPPAPQSSENAEPK